MKNEQYSNQFFKVKMYDVKRPKLKPSQPFCPDMTYLVDWVLNSKRILSYFLPKHEATGTYLRTTSTT